MRGFNKKFNSNQVHFNARDRKMGKIDTSEENKLENIPEIDENDYNKYAAAPVGDLLLEKPSYFNMLDDDNNCSEDELVPGENNYIEIDCLPLDGANDNA